MNFSARAKSRTTQAIAGAILLGGLAPAAAFVLAMTQLWMGDIGVYIGLGLSCAAYTFHAFVLCPRERSFMQLLAFGLSLILALTYPAWMNPVNDFAGVLTASFEPRPMMGVPNFNGVHMMVTPMLTGAIMAVALWAMTRSIGLLATVLIASVLCGLVVVPTGGASCVPWNLAVAISLYKWSGPWPRAAQMAPSVCPTCGYSLAGLPTDQCPECGQRPPPALGAG